MDNLRNVIDILFRRIPAAKAISNLKKLKSNEVMLQDGIYANDYNKQELFKALRAYMPNYSEDEIYNLLKSIASEDMSYYNLFGKRRTKSKVDVFELIIRFSNKALIYKNSEILCEYKELLRWRMLTNLLGEDMFITAFAAYNDLYYGNLRTYFNWSVVLGNNNVRLSNMLRKGISENHFHLFGSAPSFHLSWINLMNNIINSSFTAKNKIKKKIDAFDIDTLSPKISYDGSAAPSLFMECIRACVIRLFLFCELHDLDFDVQDLNVTLNEIKNMVSHIPCDIVGIDTDKYNSLLDDKNFGISHYSFIGNVDFCVFGRDETCGNRELRKSVELLFDRLVHTDNGIINRTGIISLGEFLRLLPAEQYQLSLSELKPLLEPEYYGRLKRLKQRDFLITILNNDFQMDRHLTQLNSLLIFIKQEYSVKMRYNAGDYAILNKQKVYLKDVNFLLYGERKFQYDMFTEIYDGAYANDALIQNMFYAYLQIKVRFRSEMIQVNDNVGFQNFDNYQGRKELFIEGNKLYEDLIVYMAVNDSFASQKINSLEARITPKTHSYINATEIKRINDIIKRNKPDYEEFLNDGTYRLIEKYFKKRINEKENPAERDKPSNAYERSFYVMHFVKKKDINYQDKGNADYSYAKSRHFAFRLEIKKRAEALVALRNGNPSAAKRIYGIDACSNELHCRPEVFAIAFRYLKTHSVQPITPLLDVQLHGLNMTYHVGEDFLDVVDGLRAIEECIRFLNMGESSRMGHATALGVDVDLWYKSRRNMVELTKHVLLDNLAWMYAKIRKYSIEVCYGFAAEIEKQFDKYFYEVYTKNELDKYKKSLEKTANTRNTDGRDFDGSAYDKILERIGTTNYFNISVYYDAWKLRGDDPEYYKTGEFEWRPQFTLWEQCSLNRLYPIDEKIRLNYVASHLYYRYHYDYEVKKRGDQSVEFYVTEEYIFIAKEIQKHIKSLINRHHISIECNPSSNYKISGLQKYSDHPITRWYSAGLYESDEPQLHVSINTDDQGVFNTNLENEYALMAIALEKEKTGTGAQKYNQAQIYDWLDRIREMGNEQSFKLTDV